MSAVHPDIRGTFDADTTEANSLHASSLHASSHSIAPSFPTPGTQPSDDDGEQPEQDAREDPPAASTTAGTAGSSGTSAGPAELRKLSALPRGVQCASIFTCIGMGLAGYDTSIISGTIRAISEDLALKEELWKQEAVVSMCVLGGAVGSLYTFFHEAVAKQVLGVTTVPLLGKKQSSSERISKRQLLLLGRRPVMMFAACGYVVGSLVAACAETFPSMLLGRFAKGVCIGLFSVVLPVFIAECAPPEWRGRLVTHLDLFICVGQVIAGTVNGFMQDYAHGWRASIALAAIPGSILFLGLYFGWVPESPRYLVMVLFFPRVVLLIADPKEKNKLCNSFLLLRFSAWVCTAIGSQSLH